MLQLRQSVTAPLLCLLACTPIGDPGDDHDTAPPEELNDDAAVDGPPTGSGRPREALQGDALAAEIKVTDDDARCSDADVPTQAEPIDPKAALVQGRMAVRQGDAWLGLPLRETRYDTVVVGNMAETSVVQVFHNPTRDRLEALYNFPLPADAAVDDYWIRVGGREIRGLMKSRADARKTYEAARDAGQTAALLEQNRPNVFAQAVANIAPGETIEIEMHVVQPLRREAGRYTLTLPITVGPRYSPGSPDPAGNTTQVPDAAAINSPHLPAGGVRCSPVDIAVAIEAGLPITDLRSKYHALTVARTADTTRLELARAARPNRDFTVSWQLAGLEPRARLMAQSSADGDGYFTLAVEPPQAYPQEDARPRELVFALDTSGSMQGAPMETAVAAVRKALDGMGKDDTFQILRFAGDTSQLAASPLRNTAANRQRGLDFLTTMNAGGGTEMMAGIKAALEQPGDPERLRMVLFLTDGYIGDDVAVIGQIERSLGDARLFGLGVGSSVNHFLLDGMSRIGRGAVTYVGPGEATDDVVERFYGYIGRPVLTDIEIDWGTLPVADVVPNALPDLFAGQPVVVYGRFTGPATGQATLKGKLGGHAVTMPLRLDFDDGLAHTGLASMWARQQVDAMLGYPNIKRTEHDTKIIEAVTALAIRHRVMTQYTSFVAVETKRAPQKDGAGQTVQVPLELPYGADFGTLNGSEIGESYGVGGLGLIGTGGGGTGSGYGRGAGAGFGGRGTRVPVVRQARHQVIGAMDDAVVRRIVRAHINEVRHCYNQVLASDPNAKGRITVVFTIGVDGKVTVAEISENTLTDRTIGTCMVKAVERWSFPRSAEKVVVTYPFVLEPG